MAGVITLFATAFGIACGTTPTADVDDYPWLFVVHGSVRDSAASSVQGAEVRIVGFAGPCASLPTSLPEARAETNPGGLYVGWIMSRGAFVGCVRVRATHPNGPAFGTAEVMREGVHMAIPERDSLVIDVTLRSP